MRAPVSGSAPFHRVAALLPGVKSTLQRDGISPARPVHQECPTGTRMLARSSAVEDWLLVGRDFGGRCPRLALDLVKWNQQRARCVHPLIRLRPTNIDEYGLASLYFGKCLIDGDPLCFRLLSGGLGRSTRLPDADTACGHSKHARREKALK